MSTAAKGVMADVVLGAAAPFTGALAAEPLAARLVLERAELLVGPRWFLPSLWFGTELEVSDLESSIFRL